MQSYRLLGVALVVGAVMFVDVRYPQWVEPVRHYALQLFEPVLRLLSYPERIYDVANESILSHQQLLQENKLLKSLLLQNRFKCSKSASLKPKICVYLP
ncbi:MAG: hypothetical protein IPI79_05010 [Moraxellaceae bacterium]|nr:hypothetical protein [Moraxellaceae bacterium]